MNFLVVVFFILSSGTSYSQTIAAADPAVSDTTLPILPVEVTYHFDTLKEKTAVADFNTK